MIKILMVATEAKPYATAGGTSDVVGILSRVLRQQGYDVRLVLPYYSTLVGSPQYQLQPAATLEVPVGTRPVYATVHQAALSNPDPAGGTYPAYLIGGDPDGYLARANGKTVPLYPALEDSTADAGRLYAFFCRAALELARRFHQEGWHPDVIHCHDWPTGLIPVYRKIALPRDPSLEGTRIVFTIHNISDVVYQGGWFTPVVLQQARLPLSLFRDGQVEHNSRVNFIKAAIVFADRVNTVSEGYAEEIKRNDQECFLALTGEHRTYRCSGGLHYVWSYFGIQPIGIRNGIDDAYDPRRIGQDGDWPLVATDWQTHFAPAQGRPLAEWAYSPDDPEMLRKKALLKRYLQDRCNRLLGAGLEVDERIPVIAVRSRLVEQKGFDLLIAGLSQWCPTCPVQFIIVAWGDDSQARLYGLELDRLAQSYPGRIAFSRSWRDLPEPLHYAGADMLLMPSLFEPCGLPHMMALRYGTVPIVRRTGGLADVVEESDPIRDRGNGFDFIAPDHREAFQAVERALRTYVSPEHWGRLVRNAIQARDRQGRDFSWGAAAERYAAELYD
jgi:starch synthase